LSAPLSWSPFSLPVPSSVLSPSPFFFSIIQPPPTSTLFPYTTLFRSGDATCQLAEALQALGLLKLPLLFSLLGDVLLHHHPGLEIGRAHVLTPVTSLSRMPSSA